MAYLRVLLFLLPAAALIAACGNSVTIPESDNTPPTVKMIAISGGENRGMVETGGSAATAFHYAQDPASVLVTAEDVGGVKRVEVWTLSSGQLKDPGGSGPPAPRFDDTGSRDNPLDQLGMGTGPVYADGDDTVEIRAEGEDFHGNIATTPTLTMRKVTRATSTLTATPNPMPSDQSATLSWNVSGSNFKSAVLTKGAGQVIETNARASGSRLVSPSSDTTYTLRVETHMPQPNTPSGAQERLQVSAPLNPQVSLNASDTTVDAGDTVTFSYSSQDVDVVEVPALNFGPDPSSSSSFTRTLNQDVTARAYGLDQAGQQIAQSSQVQVTVNVPQTYILSRNSMTPSNAGHDDCANTQSEVDVALSAVQFPYGTYTQVAEVQVAFNTSTENVTIYHGGSQTTIGAQAGGNTGDTTTYFNGDNVTQGTWCFNLGSDAESPGIDSLPVTFTLTQ